MSDQQQDARSFRGGPHPFISRKQFIAGAASAGALIATSPWWGVPAEAAARGRPVQPLGRHRRTLSAWCDLLVPGADRNHVARFVDDQLRLPHERAKLLLRYFNWPPPYADFYVGGLTALDEASGQLFAGRRFVQLDASKRATVRDRVLAGTVDWSGPPAQLFYLVTRGDGVDVVYGTEQGFARLDIPYQPLVRPKRPW